jgi:transposase-like protein
MSTDRKGATTTREHRKPEVEAAQEVSLDDADFLREIVQRVLQEVLEAQMTEHIRAAPTSAPTPARAIEMATSPGL